MTTIFVCENKEYNRNYTKGSDNNWLLEDNLTELLGTDTSAIDEAEINDIQSEVYQKLEKFEYIKSPKFKADKISFSFIGVIVVDNIIIKSYPKYITKNEKPNEELKQILKVIKKYNKKKEHDIFMNSYAYGDEPFNILSIMLLLVDDYNENGEYINKKEIIEVNGNGEILWDKTINESFTFIQNNQPYYLETFNKKSANDNFDYFKRLHESVITKISLYLKKCDLLELLELDELDLSDEEIEDFGDLDFIINKLEGELLQEFNTRKQIVLNALISYLSQEEKFEKANYINSFSTKNFLQVWEDVCQDVMNDVIHTNFYDLPLDDAVKSEYEHLENLKDMLEKPIWTDVKTNKSTSKNTLELDCISLYSPTNPTEHDLFFIITDAKYYHIDLSVEDGELKLAGVPGISDITKQYLYQLAYKDLIDFIRENPKQNVCVKNCLLAPSENDEIQKLTVNLDMFTGESLNLALLDTFLLPAKDIYDLYLNDNMVKQIKLEYMFTHFFDL